METEAASAASEINQDFIDTDINTYMYSDDSIAANYSEPCKLVLTRQFNETVFIDEKVALTFLSHSGAGYCFKVSSTLGPDSTVNLKYNNQVQVKNVINVFIKKDKPLTINHHTKVYAINFNHQGVAIRFEAPKEINIRREELRPRVNNKSETSVANSN